MNQVHQLILKMGVEYGKLSCLNIPKKNAFLQKKLPSSFEEQYREEESRKEEQRCKEERRKEEHRRQRNEEEQREQRRRDKRREDMFMSLMTAGLAAFTGGNVNATSLARAIRPREEMEDDDSGPTHKQSKPAHQKDDNN